MTTLLLFIQLCFVTYVQSVEWITLTVKTAYVAMCGCCEDEERMMRSGY
ncbi:hypothetical protein QF013_002662 [Pseudomonas laurylsulfatiphila]